MPLHKQENQNLSFIPLKCKAVRKCPEPHKFLSLLYLADDFAGAAQRLYHLLAFLAPANGVIRLLQKVIKLVCAIHILKKFFLHLVFGEPEERAGG